MKKTSNTSGKDSNCRNIKRVLNAHRRIGVVLLIIIGMTIVYMNQVIFAESHPKQVTEDKAIVDIQAGIGIGDSEDNTNNDAVANPSSHIDSTPQTKDTETTVKDGTNDIIAEDKGTSLDQGKDMSNDPDYIAELNRIYSKEDLARMKAPRQWVIMPDFIGMTEADTINTMHSMGLTARVIYEDNPGSEVKEGECFCQDIQPGLRVNTDASLFIWIKRNVKLETESAIKDRAEPTPKPMETPAPAQITDSTNRTSQDAEPSSTSEPVNLVH